MHSIRPSRKLRLNCLLMLGIFVSALMVAGPIFPDALNRVENKGLPATAWSSSAGSAEVCAIIENPAATGTVEVAPAEYLPSEGRIVPRTEETEHLFSPDDTESEGVIVLQPREEAAANSSPYVWYNWSGSIPIADQGDWVGINCTEPTSIPSGYKVTMVQVHHEITHTYVGDLQVKVFNADHTWMVRENDGGSAVNLNEDRYSTTAFYNDDPKQDWYYRVRDTLGGDSGTLTAMKLYIYYKIPRPDLLPYQPEQWNDKIPIGIEELAGSDAHSYSETFRQDQTLYFNWAAANMGDLPAENYTVRLEIVGPENFSYEWGGQSTQPGYYIRLIQDREVGPLAAGEYTFKLILDDTGTVEESNEGNNYYERTITVLPPPEKADLAPYCPTEWDDNIPIGTELLTGDDLHSYTGPYCSDQELYFNWASANMGDEPAEGYTVRFEIGGPENHYWEWDDCSTPGRHFTYLTNDQVVGPLVAGEYTFKLALDYTGVVNESTKSNNYYERTIEVSDRESLAPAIRVYPDTINLEALAGPVESRETTNLLGEDRSELRTLSGDGSGVTLELNSGELGTSLGADGTTRFTMEGFSLYASPGDPLVPYREYFVAVPPGVDPSSVRFSISAVEEYELEGDYDLYPAPPAAFRDGNRTVLFWGEGKSIVDGRNVLIYDSSEAYPAAVAEKFGGTRMRQWRIVSFGFFPLRWNPATGKVTVTARAEVRLDFATRKALSSVEENELSDTGMDDRAERLLSNYTVAREWYRPTKKRVGKTYDYLIVTTEAIRTASTELAEFEIHQENRGYQVATVTESSFYPDLSGEATADGWGGGSGDAAAENLRGWLAENYADLGVVYALLIGDPHPAYGDLPMKVCWPRYHESEYRSAPTDYYYAELTSDWDQDGDGYFGEYIDDIGSGPLITDIYLGRIPVYGSSCTALDSILVKTINYADNPGTWRGKVLLPMEPSDEMTNGWPLGEGIKSDFADPREISAVRIYDTTNAYSGNPIAGPAAELTPCSTASVLSEWPEGYGLVTWWTHGSPTSAADVINSSLVNLLDDSRPALVFQCSCNNGYPENTGNLGYLLLESGAVATVSASRVSWYYRGDENWNLDGSNSSLAYRYSGKILADFPCGRALNDTRNESSRSTAARWMNHLVFNLYGDPSLNLNPGGNAQGRVTIFNDGLGELLVDDLQFQDGSSWLSFDAPALPFSIKAGGSAPVGLNLSAGGLAPGAYSERVLIHSNAPGGSPYPDGIYVNFSVLGLPSSPTPTVLVTPTPTPDLTDPTPAPTAYQPPAATPTTAPTAAPTTAPTTVPTPLPQQVLNLGSFTVYADQIASVSADAWPKTASGNVNLNGVIFADGEIEIRRDGGLDGIYQIQGNTRLYLTEIPLPWAAAPVEVTLYDGGFSYEVDVNGLTLDSLNDALSFLRVAGLEAKIQTISFLESGDGVEISASLDLPAREAAIRLGRLRISRIEGIAVDGVITVAGLDIEVDELEVSSDRLTLNYGKIVFPDFFAPEGLSLTNGDGESVNGRSASASCDFIARAAEDPETRSILSDDPEICHLTSDRSLYGTVQDSDSDYPASFVAFLYRLSGEEPSSADELIDIRTADGEGRFQFGKLPAGTYAVSAEGRVTVEINDLEISANGFYLGSGEVTNIPDFEYAGVTLSVESLTFSTDPPGANLFNVDLVLPKTLGGGTAYLELLQLTEDGVQVSGKIEDFSFTIPNSGFGLTVEELFFDTINNRFGGTASLRAPTLPVITVGVGFTGREISWVRAEVQELNYPIYAVVFLQRIVLDINNLEPGPPPPIIVAAVGLSAGPTWPIPFTSNSIVLLAADPIALTIDTGDYAEIAGDLTLFKPTSGDMVGRISFLRWGWNYSFSGFDLAGAQARISRTSGFTASAYLDILSILKGNTTLSVSRSNRVSGKTVGTLQVPPQVPVIGNKRLGGFSSVLNNDCLAGEGWVSRLLRVAVRFDYDGQIQFGRNLASLGVNQISGRRLAALGAPGARLAAREEITVEEGMKRAIFRFAWEAGETEAYLITPGGTEITPADGPLNSEFCNYIYDAVNREAWYVVSNPTAGKWSYRLSNYEVGGLTVELLDLEEPPMVELAGSDAVSRGGVRLTAGQSFHLEWSTSGLTGGEEISLYYDEKNNDFTGLPIAEGIPAVQGWYDWVVDETVSSGNYFIYAVLDNGRSSPSASYMPGMVMVSNPLAPAAPGNLTLAVEGREVTVSWEANQEADLLGYVLEWTDNLTAVGYNERLSVGLETVHTLDGLLSGRQYKIRVKAVNDAGHVSLPSEAGSCQLGGTAKNSPPQITTGPITRARAGECYSYQVEAVDDEGDELDYRLFDKPAGMLIDPVTGLIEWTPGPDDVGLAEIAIEVSDASSATRQRFSLEVYNSYMGEINPLITSVPTGTAQVGQEYTYRVLAVASGEKKLTFVLASSPAGMTISPEGVISWTPQVSDLLGEKLVEVRVSRPEGGISRQVFTIILRNVTLPPATPTPALSPTPAPTLAPTPPPTPAPTHTLAPSPTPSPTSSPEPTPDGENSQPFYRVDSGDYDGDGSSDIAIFRPASGLWAVRRGTRVYFGSEGDLPVSGDYNGDGTSNIAVFRPSSGLWAIRNHTRLYFGTVGDLPIPGDYLGGGTCEIAVFRPASGLWAFGGGTRAYFGNEGDLPIFGDYTGDGTSDLAVFRPSSGLWAIRNYTRLYLGAADDLPEPGDYSGNDYWVPGIFRPSNGLWAILQADRSYFGSGDDLPVIGDYEGDGIDRLGIFRSSSGLWAISGVTRAYFGSDGDQPATR